jgi:hypothetical protein
MSGEFLTHPSPHGGEGKSEGMVWISGNWNLFGAWDLVIVILF